MIAEIRRIHWALLTASILFIVAVIEFRIADGSSYAFTDDDFVEWEKVMIPLALVVTVMGSLLTVRKDQRTIGVGILLGVAVGAVLIFVGFCYYLFVNGS